MERRAGDLLFGKTLVFSNFQMAGKSYFTNMSLSRVFEICGIKGTRKGATGYL